MTRRHFCLSSAAALAGCAAHGDSRSNARLESAPGANSGKPNAALRDAGVHRIRTRGRRESTLYVPKSLGPNPALVLYLHGAGGSEEQGVKRLGGLAESLGFLLLSPASDDRTWDAIRGGFGPDVRSIDQALGETFAAWNGIDRGRIVVAGFSDGASYALGLGLRNSLFSAITAFSPGFVAGGLTVAAKPRIFISHGTDDQILPIDDCSRAMVPVLRSNGLTVDFREFAGPHTVPPEMAEALLRKALA